VADNRVERRLAAILAADVAGYSRLMGADEEGVLARLKAARKSLVDPTIVRRFLDLFDRAGPIFKSADIIDLVVTTSSSRWTNKSPNGP